jgi:hypothetical protein
VYLLRQCSRSPFTGVAPISLIGNCSNTGFAASFNAGDGAVWVITATGLGPVYTANQMVPIDIAMSIAQ